MYGNTSMDSHAIPNLHFVGQERSKPAFQKLSSAFLKKHVGGGVCKTVITVAGGRKVKYYNHLDSTSDGELYQDLSRIRIDDTSPDAASYDLLNFWHAARKNHLIDPAQTTYGFSAQRAAAHSYGRASTGSTASSLGTAAKPPREQPRLKLDVTFQADEIDNDFLADGPYDGGHIDRLKRSSSPPPPPPPPGFPSYYTIVGRQAFGGAPPLTPPDSPVDCEDKADHAQDASENKLDLRTTAPQFASESADITRITARGISEPDATGTQPFLTGQSGPVVSAEMEQPVNQKDADMAAARSLLALALPFGKSAAQTPASTLESATNNTHDSSIIRLVKAGLEGGKSQPMLSPPPSRDGLGASWNHVASFNQLTTKTTVPEVDADAMVEIAANSVPKTDVFDYEDPAILEEVNGIGSSSSEDEDDNTYYGGHLKLRGHAQGHRTRVLNNTASESDIRLFCQEMIPISNYHIKTSQVYDLRRFVLAKTFVKRCRQSIGRLGSWETNIVI